MLSSGRHAKGMRRGSGTVTRAPGSGTGGCPRPLPHRVVCKLSWQGRAPQLLPCSNPTATRCAARGHRAGTGRDGTAARLKGRVDPEARTSAGMHGRAFALPAPQLPAPCLPAPACPLAGRTASQVQLRRVLHSLDLDLAAQLVRRQDHPQRASGAVGPVVAGEEAIVDSLYMSGRGRRCRTAQDHAC